jgi:hypothetical protein
LFLAETKSSLYDFASYICYSELVVNIRTSSIGIAANKPAIELRLPSGKNEVVTSHVQVIELQY